LLALLLATGCSSSTDISRDVEQAQKLLAAGNYNQAFDEYQRVAKQKDNPLAKHALAMFYDFGWGRPVDRVKACQWYEQAAKGSIPVAADALGRCLTEGRHRDTDYAEAAMWFQKAADLGHHYSLCHLGALYISGQGVARDPAKGLDLCRQSAEQGSVPSMLRLVDFYQDEEGIRDDAQALRWLSLAASYQSVEAQYRLGVMLRDGRGINKDPVVAREWFEQAASHGYEPAYFETARLYFNAPANPETGLWHENDLAKAYMWLSATLQRTENAEQRKQAGEMMAKVREVMPESWAADLDAKVDTHLHRYAAADTKPD
jgi:TPR repeat protein